MDRLCLKRLVAALALLVASALPSAGQQFQYTPYKGSNDTGGQPTTPPPDDYTPAHQGGVQSGAPAYDSGDAVPEAPRAARQGAASDAYGSSGRAAAPSGNSYSPPGGAYSPSEDVYSPAPRGGEDATPPPPPRGVGGPSGAAEGLPPVEVQAAAPDDGIPFEVRQEDARRAAIEGWRSKVAQQYGPEFSQWQSAIAKRLDCHRDRRDGVICTASAQPSRGFSDDGPPPPDRRRY